MSRKPPGGSIVEPPSDQGAEGASDIQKPARKRRDRVALTTLFHVHREKPHRIPRGRAHRPLDQYDHKCGHAQSSASFRDHGMD